MKSDLDIRKTSQEINDWKPSAPPRALTPAEKEFEKQIQDSYAPIGLHKRKYQPGEKIAILGAGIAGLSIARNLINKGVPGSDITVYEERNLPGGKTRGLFIPDQNGNPRHYELGAAVIIPGRYKLIEDLIKKHNLATRPLDAPIFLKDGKALPDPTPDEIAKLKMQAGYYLGLFKNNPSWMSIMSPDGYRNVPDELEVPWSEFLKKYGDNFSTLNQRLAVAIGGSGFLMSQDPPFAAQILRFINPSFLIPILTPGQGSRVFEELNGPCLEDKSFVQDNSINGFQCLWIREAHDLAAHHGVQFQFGTRITKIKRGEMIELTMQKQIKSTDDANEQIGFSAVKFEKPVLAPKVRHVFYTGDLRYLTSSPWLPVANKARATGILDQASSGEKELYQSIDIYPYKSYMVRLKNFPIEQKSSFFALLPQILNGEKNRAVLMMRTYTDTDVFQIWGYGDRTNESTEEFLTVFQEDMSKLGVPFDKDKDVLVKSDWDYFPHATPKNGKTLKDFFQQCYGTARSWRPVVFK